MSAERPARFKRSAAPFIMTARFDRKEINSRHLVAFRKKYTDSQKLYYYDFEPQAWREVVPLDPLPYNLHSYRFVDDLDEKCVVTSTDSYRLTFDLETVPNNTTMEEERVWRKDICKDGAEFEYIDHTGNVHKAQVCWCKADIVPGVVLCGPRESPNINPFGYIFKESKKLCRTGTHFPALTADEIEQERVSNEKLTKQSQEQENKITEWLNKLPLLSFKSCIGETIPGVGEVKVRDPKEFWQSLNKCKQEITVDYVLKSGKVVDEKSVRTADNFQLTCVGLLISKTDVCYTSDNLNTRDGSEYYTLPNNWDFYFDIQVHNASYAYLYCGDLDDDNVWKRRFDMEQLADSVGVYTLHDISYHNPLYRSTSGSRYYIYTDGDRITFNGGVMNTMPRYIFLSIAGKWMFNTLQGRVLLNGNLWAPSMSFPIKDMITL